MVPRDTGKAGENLAKQYLTNLGYAFLDSNYRTAYGEIDLIYMDGPALVFVEVKTRVKDAGEIEFSIDKRKANRILKSAEIYITNSGLEFKEIRVDALFVVMTDGGPVFKHLKSFY